MRYKARCETTHLQNSHLTVEYRFKDYRKGRLPERVWDTCFGNLMCPGSVPLSVNVPEVRTPWGRYVHAIVLCSSCGCKADWPKIHGHAGCLSSTVSKDLNRTAPSWARHLLTVSNASWDEDTEGVLAVVLKLSSSTASRLVGQLGCCPPGELGLVVSPLYDARLTCGPIWWC